MSLRTVRVPPGMEGVFAAAEKVVASYFEATHHAPDRGTIEISGERYVLVRAAALSVDFFAVIRNVYGRGREREADRFARNVLFDLAHTVGASDARRFTARTGVDDPLARLSAGPVLFAHAGWAFVHIHPESKPEPSDDFFLVFDHPYSFEASAWLEAMETPAFPVCVMNAGYSAGWCTASYGIDLVSSEIMCRARGDQCCRFVMAPPARIEERVERYRQTLGPQAASRARHHPTPDLFARKRMEEELRRSRDELDARVRARTAELEATYARLEQEIRQRAEVERRLAQAQKLEAVGRLAGGVAHDFNNLLGVVLGRSSMVQSRVAPGDPLWEDMEAIRVACRQGVTLTRHMITFSRGQPADVRAIDLNAHVRAFSDGVPALVGRNVSVELSLGPEPLSVVADAAELEQVLINLVVNARDAMPDGGRLEVRTSAIETPELEVTTTRLPEGRYAVLAVRDGGVGMDGEVLSRIFDPYFSTKAPGEGTGLGLSTVYRVVHQAKGGIRVESTPGAGTCFTVFLPLSSEPVTASPPSSSTQRAAAPVEPGARVLVVEDKSDLRATIEEGLVSAGYQVIAVGDPKLALALVESGDLELDVLLTDLAMPGLGGRELAERVRAKRPAICVLFMTGFDKSGAAGDVPVLYKPFSIDELVRKIEAVRTEADGPS